MRRSDRGGATLEVVILAPFLLALMMLIIAFARFALAENVVDQAARDGARAATAQNSKSAVASVVDAAVQDALDDAPPSCRKTVIADTDLTSGAFEPTDPDVLIDAKSVTVTVSCLVDMSDLAALPLGEVEVEHTFTSPLDRYRGYEE